MNQITLIGRLGQDPDVKEKYTTFSIATRDGKDKTNWHNCVTFQKTAELINTFKKGELIGVQGRLEYNKVNEKTYTSIVVSNIVLFPARAKTEGSKPETTNNEQDELPF